MRKLITFILLLSLIACGQTAIKQDTSVKQTELTEGWKTLDQPKYSIQYPPTWQLDSSGQMGTSFLLFSPQESGEDGFRENVNLLIQDMAGENIDLDKYTKISEEQIKTMMPNSKLIESTRIKKDATEYHKIIYNGDQEGLHLKFEQYYWVIGNKAFLLTFTSEQNKYDAFKKVGESIMNSFILK
jgi:hypothetical protein